MTRTRPAFFAALCCLTAACASAREATGDPLASWNEGPARRAILDFVEKTTKPGSPDFVPAP